MFLPTGFLIVGEKTGEQAIGFTNGTPTFFTENGFEIPIGEHDKKISTEDSTFP